MGGGAPIWERRWLRWWLLNAARLGLRPEVLAIGSAIIARFNAEGSSYPSRGTILRDAGLRDRKTYTKAIRKLERFGVLTRKRRQRRSAVYEAGPALLEELTLPGTSRIQEGPSDAPSRMQEGPCDAHQEGPCDHPQNGYQGNGYSLTPSPLPPAPAPAATPRGRPALGDRVRYGRFAEAWNEVARRTGLAEVQPPASWPETRKRALRARVKQLGEDKVMELLRAPLESAFLRGERGRESWLGATFDWLLKPTNAAKVLEGAYADTRRRRPPGTRHAESPSEGGLDVDPACKAAHAAFRDHPLFDQYVDECVATCGWGGELQPWPTFEDWRATREAELAPAAAISANR